MAEDLVQETFLRAWRSLDSLQNDSSVKAWLFTIVRRENARHYEKYQPKLVDIEDEWVASSSDNEPESEMDREILRKAINKLNDNYRDPLLLQIIGGYSGKEIAGMLELKDTTVLTRLHRARTKLLQEFDVATHAINEPNDDDPERLPAVSDNSAFELILD